MRGVNGPEECAQNWAAMALPRRQWAVRVCALGRRRRRRRRRRRLRDMHVRDRATPFLVPLLLLGVWQRSDAGGVEGSCLLGGAPRASAKGRLAARAPKGSRGGQAGVRRAKRLALERSHAVVVFFANGQQMGRGAPHLLAQTVDRVSVSAAQLICLRISVRVTGRYSTVRKQKASLGSRQSSSTHAAGSTQKQSLLRHFHHTAPGRESARPGPTTTWRSPIQKHCASE